MVCGKDIHLVIVQAAQTPRLVILQCNSGGQICLGNRQFKRQRRTIKPLQLAQIQHAITLAPDQRALCRFTDTRPGADNRIKILLRRHPQNHSSDHLRIFCAYTSYRHHPIQMNMLASRPVQIGTFHLAIFDCAFYRLGKFRRNLGLFPLCDQ